MARKTHPCIVSTNFLDESSNTLLLKGFGRKIGKESEQKILFFFPNIF